MNNRRMLWKSFLLSAWAVLLTALVVVFGGAPLRVLRSLLGVTGYSAVVVFVTGILIGFNWTALALIFLVVAVTIFLFTEAEERGHSLESSGFLSVIMGSLLIAGGFALWISRAGTGWTSLLLSRVEALLAQFPWQSSLGLEAKDILVQIPSVIVMGLMLTVYFSLLLQSRVLALIGINAKPKTYKLTQFAVPDGFIWVFLVSLAGAFLKSKFVWLNPAFANLFNICIFVFFLQGLSVVAAYFERFKISTLWQIILYAALITQVFVFAAVIGLMDYWLNLRVRMNRKTGEEIKGRSDQELFKK